MRFVSLFAGIGGIDLGLERAGHTCVGQVEIDAWATRVLEKHWPRTPRLRDVQDFNGHEFGEFDLLTGGYPCQPFSYAGSRGGVDDKRHLWPEVARIIRNVRPSYVLLENVPGHLSLGFGQVLGDLAQSGYDTQWDCIPAAAIGAPHRRDRVWIVAYPSDAKRRRGTKWQPSWNRESVLDSAHGQMANPNGGRLLHGQVEKHSTIARVNAQRDASASRATMADAACVRLQRRNARKCQGQSTIPRLLTKFAGSSGSVNFGWWATEPDVGRVAHGVPNRVDRLKGLGNAVVPQVAEWIARNWLPE